MKTFLILALLIGLTQAGTAQKIALKQTASPSDVQVVNGDYTLYFKSGDLVAAIAAIDSIDKTNNATIIGALKENKIKSISLTNTSTSDKAFADLLKSNLGSYLIIRGKVAITRGKKPLATILADESPQEVELDGSSRVHIAFTEEGNDAFIFLGQLNYKLKPGK